MDAPDDEIKISDDTDDKLDLVDEPTQQWNEAETEVQAPSVQAKPAAAPSKPGLKKPLGKPGQK